MENFINTITLEPKNAYEFISRNYGEFSHNELVNIVKELIVAIRVGTDEKEYCEIMQNVASELEDMYSVE